MNVDVDALPTTANTRNVIGEGGMPGSRLLVSTVKELPFTSNRSVVVRIQPFRVSAARILRYVLLHGGAARMNETLLRALMGEKQLLYVLHIWV